MRQEQSVSELGEIKQRKHWVASVGSETSEELKLESPQEPGGNRAGENEPTGRYKVQFLITLMCQRNKTQSIQNETQGRVGRRLRGYGVRHKRLRTRVQSPRIHIKARELRQLTCNPGR